MHALALLPKGTDEAALIAAAATRGVAVDGLRSHRADPASGPPGLILGYANLPQPAIERGIRALGAAFAAARAESG